MLTLIRHFRYLEATLLTVDIETSSNFEDFGYILEMRSQMLDEAAIESHAGLDEFEIEILGLSTLDMLLLPISISKRR